jgi:hypothetical protein
MEAVNLTGKRYRALPLAGYIANEKAPRLDHRPRGLES